MDYTAEFTHHSEFTCHNVILVCLFAVFVYCLSMVWTFIAQVYIAWYFSKEDTYGCRWILVIYVNLADEKDFITFKID